MAKAAEDHRLRHLPRRTAILAPGASLEATLVDIWQRALGTTRVGLNDNFFEVGGTSLNAVQVIATIKQELKQDVSIVSCSSVQRSDCLPQSFGRQRQGRRQPARGRRGATRSAETTEHGAARASR